MKKITHGNLFSGIGGMELAAEWCGWQNVFQVEIDKFCQKVLAKNFPKTKRYGDIKEFDGTKYRGTIDVLSASPPCQPASVAGKRKGKSDDRWLWPEALRICKEIKPSFIIFENPPGILTLENGKSFNEILLALESQGYKIEIFNIPVASKKAWHRRERIWILAYSGCRDTWQSGNAKEVSSERHGTENSSGKACRSGSNDRKRAVTNSEGHGLQKSIKESAISRKKKKHGRNDTKHG
ncbi:DNA (cytosine-5-)-methyltransferase [archaeon]|nr:DNA (cytosine-5-)-methyltransferase [archaeon]